MPSRFNSTEKKLILGISLVMGLRMLGVSMIIPIFSIFATELPRSTKALAGVAVGIFGIMQTILQIPVGRLSDRWGRKQVTIIGLFVYMVGTVLSGASRGIHHLIGARALAGSGAISGVTMAWLTEGVGENRRNAALSYVGISMGLSVIVGFTLSPLLAARVGIPFLFYLCAGIIFVTIIYTLRFTENHESADDEVIDIKKENLLAVMANRDLRKLNLIGFVANLNLNSAFFVMPLLIKESMGMSGMWKIYIPMSLTGTALMFYFGRTADRKGTVPVVMIGLVFELAGALTALMINSLPGNIASFILFYAGHCVLSPVLPAAASRHPNTRIKGTVMGLFNSCQFIGSGLGGVIAGALLEFDHRYVFGVVCFFLLTAFISAGRFRNFAEEPSTPEVGK